MSVPKLGEGLPCRIAESDSLIWNRDKQVGQNAGIHDVWDDGDVVTFDVGSGHYAFVREPA